jgi:hypothetical protein
MATCDPGYRSPYPTRKAQLDRAQEKADEKAEEVADLERTDERSSSSAAEH